MASAMSAPAALFLCVTLLALMLADGRSTQRMGSVVRPPRPSAIHSTKPAFVIPRGGAMLADDEYDDYDSEEYDEYDTAEEDEEEAAALASAAQAKAAAKAKKAKAKTASLSASAVKASAKAQSKKASRAKESVNVKLAATKTRTTSKKSLGAMLRIPYLVRACLNPFTVIAMTRAYFASLFNVSFMEEEKSQTLRSALEDKSKKAGSAGTGGRKGKRAMRPGQAKTLSDLPQLSA